MREAKPIVAMIRDNSLTFNYENADEIRDLTGPAVDKIEKMIERAVYFAIGDIRRRIENIPADPVRVVVKPNVTAEAYPEELSTTDPRVVLALCRFLKRNMPRKARITIADNSAFGEAGLTSTAMATSMIVDAAREAGPDIEIAPLDEKGFDSTRPIRVSNALVFPELSIFDRVYFADFLISLPKMKVLIDEVVSMGLKNWQGIIPCGERWMGTQQTIGRQSLLIQQAHHRADMSQKITDLQRAKRPDLTILDGIWALEGQGPWAGQRKVMNLILASTDAVALDATACRCMGLDPYNEVAHIRAAYHAGLGKVFESEIEIRFEDLGGEQPVLPDQDDIQNLYIRKVRKFFKRASPNPVGLISNIHLHVAGTCVGCMANIRGGLDNLLFDKFPFERLEAPVHIVSGLDVPIPRRLEGHVIVVGDCAAIKLVRVIKEDGTPDATLIRDERGQPTLSTVEKVQQACVDPAKQILYYWGCAPVTIFGKLPEIFRAILHAQASER